MKFLCREIRECFRCLFALLITTMVKQHCQLLALQTNLTVMNDSSLTQSTTLTHKLTRRRTVNICQINFVNRKSFCSLFRLFVRLSIRLFLFGASFLKHSSVPRKLLSSVILSICINFDIRLWKSIYVPGEIRYWNELLFTAISTPLIKIQRGLFVYLWFEYFWRPNIGPSKAGLLV